MRGRRAGRHRDTQTPSRCACALRATVCVRRGVWKRRVGAPSSTLPMLRALPARIVELLRAHHERHQEEELRRACASTRVRHLSCARRCSIFLLRDIFAAGHICSPLLVGGRYLAAASSACACHHAAPYLRWPPAPHRHRLRCLHALAAGGYPALLLLQPWRKDAPRGEGTPLTPAKAPLVQVDKWRSRT